VYALSLTTSCTAWTYYGSVGFVTSTGLLLLAVYLGPTFAAAMWGDVLRKMARIFDRFERAVSTRHYGGLGLGLYVSRRIVEAHGGTIRVASRPGDGATFTVELPRSLAGVAAAATGVAQPEARHA